MLKRVGKPVLRLWEAVVLVGLVTAASLGLATLEIKSDLRVAEKKFNDQAQGFQRELVANFSDVDAILTSLSIMHYADNDILQQQHRLIARQLLAAYPFIGAILHVGFEGDTPIADLVGGVGQSRPLMLTAIDAVTPDQSNLIDIDRAVRRSLGKSANASVDSGETATSNVITLSSGMNVFLAVRSHFTGVEPPATAPEREAAFAGAIALYLDSDEFFEVSEDWFLSLSVWRQDFDLPVGEARPLFERLRQSDAGWVARMLPVFQTAINLDIAGTTFWIAASGQPSMQDIHLHSVLLSIFAPVVVGAIGMAALLVHRQAANRANQDADRLGESEQRFKDFAEASVDWFWEMDAELRFSWFSDRFTIVTGVPEENLLGKTRRETGIPNIDQDTWDQHLADLDARRSFREFIHPRVKSNGDTVWLVINGKAIFDTSGHFRGYRGNGRDITAQVQYQQELAEARVAAEAANTSKSEFLASMSHELRTPLNAVIGFANLLQMKEGSSADDLERREFATHIFDSGQHLMSLINDLLDLSKIEAGLDELREETFEVREVVTAGYKMSMNRGSEAGVETVLDVPEGLPRLRGDRRKVTQILLNLLSNALKFSTRGRRVILKARLAADGGILFDIIDTGIGIAPEDLPKAFAKFSQIDSALSRKVEGTGLGLPLTVRLVEQHEGTLDVQSKVGEGSTFSVHFPPERSIPNTKSAVLDQALIDGGGQTKSGLFKTA